MRLRETWKFAFTAFASLVLFLKEVANNTKGKR